MSLLTQSLLEVKAHAHAITKRELAVLRTSHRHPPEDVVKKHLIDGKPNVPIVGAAVPKAVKHIHTAVVEKPVEEAPKKPKERQRDEVTDRLRAELKLADKIIDVIYESLSPEQKVLIGKKLIHQKLSGGTVTRSEERKKATNLYR